MSQIISNIPQHFTWESLGIPNKDFADDCQSGFLSNRHQNSRPMDGQIVECVIKPTTSSQTEKQARKQACSGSSQFSRAGAGSGAGAGAGTGAGTYCYCVVPWLEVFEGVAGHVLCTLSQLV